MFIRRRIVQQAIKNLEANPLWSEAEQIARKNIYCVHYGVGGMLYRNIISVLYNTPEPTGYDFDFLVMGEARKQWLPPGWYWKGGGPIPAQSGPFTLSRIYPVAAGNYNSGTGGSPHKVPARNSVTAVHESTRLKVDLVSILDIMKQQGTSEKEVTTYFNAVPLDIQRIAYDFRTGRLWGEAIAAITARQVKVNNAKAFDIYQIPRDIDDYGLEKTRTLPGFRFTGIKPSDHDCHCDILVVMNRGCQCGGIQNERRRKRQNGTVGKQAKLLSQQRMGYPRP